MAQIFLALLLWGTALAPSPVEIAIIVHPDVPVEYLSTSDLQQLYTMEQTRWSDGSRVQLFDLRGHDDVRHRLYDVLRREPHDLKRAWMRLVLSGEGQSPTVVASPEAMVKGVASTPGAIGYVPASYVTPRVKVVMRLRGQ